MCEEFDGLCNGSPKVIHGSSGSLSENGLEFSVYLFDGIEVGRVRRQEHACRARHLGGLFDAGDLVSRLAVHNEHIARYQGGNADLLHITEVVERPLVRE